ncbi:hypothetical protein [Paenibacillus spongiae]|uniref:MFS transporter n=1 Tax=Paenibacillus spongiae TaxID=2909671 RepID=A0ABY5S3J4_9BACL|nr:hypothetical protein [Paenibacillus spongiae]UVI28466.1 hypothetical protein L1F29_23860 [Paenibacillus spongiae]
MGLLLGSGLTGKFSNRMEAACIFAFLLDGILNIFISQAGNFGMAVIFMTLTACCTAIGNDCNRTMLMNVVPHRFQGRFFGMLATLQNTIMGAAMFLSGISLEVLSPRALGLAGGILLSAAGAGFVLVYYKNKHIRNRQ